MSSGASGDIYHHAVLVCAVAILPLTRLENLSIIVAMSVHQMTGRGE